MMQMNSGIILAGQQPDILGILDRSNQAAQTQIGNQRQNALADLYQTQGPGIAAGDPGALNALAQFDPNAAVQMQAQQQRMAFDAEEMQMTRDAARQAAAEWAASKSAAEVQQQADELAREMRGAATFHAQGDRQGYEAYLVQNGLDPAKYPFDQFLAIAAMVDGVLEVWKEFRPEEPKPADPFTLSPGQTRFNPDGTVAASVAPAPKGPALTTTLPDGTVIQLGGAASTGDASTRTGQVFDEMKASADAARAAETGLNALKEASTALAGDTITGFAANQRLAAAKLGALFGIGDPAVIENTETFRSAIAPQVAAMMKATVGSTQISNADREFAEKAAGGAITLDEASIKRLLGIMEKASRAIIEKHNAKLDEVYPDGSGADRERALFRVTGTAAGSDLPPPEASQQGFQLSPEAQSVYDKYRSGATP